MARKPIDRNKRRGGKGANPRRRAKDPVLARQLKFVGRQTIQLLDRLAQGQYDPHWLEAMPEGRHRDHFEQLFEKIRRDQDLGDGVTTLRELMIRRAVWLDYWLTRVDSLMIREERRAARLTLTGTKSAKALAALTVAHAHLTRSLAHCCLALGVDARPDAIDNAARAARKARRKNTIALPDL